MSIPRRESLTREQQRNFETVSFLCGGAAGIFSTILTNPFDTLRSRLAASRDATGVHQKRLWTHIRELFSSGIKEGFRVGMWMNLLSSVPSNAIYLGSYKVVRERISALWGFDPTVVPFCSATGAVICTNVTLAPLFTIRTRVQLDSNLKGWQCFMDIVRKEGYRGLYRGLAVNAGGRIVEEALFWMIYENLKVITNEGTFKDRHIAWASFAVVSLSSISKLIGVIVAYPYNVIMTHVREVNKVTGKHEHHRLIPTARFVYRKDGLVGFYKGLAPQLCRSVLSKSSQLFAFELLLGLYQQKKNVWWGC